MRAYAKDAFFDQNFTNIMFGREYGISSVGEHARF
jgi:hypothetical protein